MSIQNRFTEDEIFLLSSTPTMIGSAMAFSGKSGAIGTVKEALANVKGVMAGLKEYPDNAIIAGILPNVADREESIERAKALRAKALERMKANGINTQEAFAEQMLKDCAAVNTLLDAKASPEEASEYRDWSMSVAEKVANAASEGGFMGFGGERFSESERTMFASINSALGGGTMTA